MQTAAAIIQAVSAVFIALLTLFLVFATSKYAKTAQGLLRLNQEQFERDWRPELRIADIQRTGVGEVYLRVANLAKPAALVRQLKIGTGGSARQNRRPQDVVTYPLTLLVPGGQIYDQVWIHSELGQYRQKYNPPPLTGSRSPWQSSMNIALVYDSAGKENQTHWIDCSVYFMDNAVTNIGRLD